MIDLIFTLIVMLAVVAAAELVRVTCRRQLTSPVALKRVGVEEPAEIAAEQVLA